MKWEKIQILKAATAWEHAENECDITVAVGTAATNNP